MGKLALKSQRSKENLTRKSSKLDIKKPPRPKLAEVAYAAIAIQRAYRRYKKRKEEKRKKLAKSTQQKTSVLKSQRSQQELTRRPIKTTSFEKTTKTAVRKQPSRPKLADVVHAAITIQRAYRRYKKRKIERVNMTRKQDQKKSGLKSQKSKQELTRKTSKTNQGPLRKQKSKPKFAEVVHAAITIQRAYRRYKKKKEEKRKKKAKTTQQQKSKFKSQKSKPKL